MPDPRLGIMLRTVRGQQSAEKFADAIGVQRSYISMLEKGRRKPSRHLVNRVAAYKNLSQGDHTALLHLAGYTEEALPFQEQMVRVIGELNLDEREADLLVREFGAYAMRWHKLRQARSQDVKTAVIPAAGLRAGFLAPASLEMSILHAAREAVRGGIKTVVVVVAPTKEPPKFEKIRALGVEVKAVVQEYPRGLGDAILATHPVTSEGPFAVILPVDVNPRLAILRNMIECYKKVRRPIVGVNHLTVGKREAQSYGSVILDKARIDEIGDSSEPIFQRIRYIAEMSETETVTRAGASRVIMGRYILTPDVFDVLQSTGTNKITEKIEITDALQELRRRGHRICAYEFAQNNADEVMLPTAPIRVLLQMFFESISEPEKLSPIIEATRKALEDISGTNMKKRKRR
jgi:UTP-glucose-1-phosphate uridylyltransferase